MKCSLAGGAAKEHFALPISLQPFPKYGVLVLNKLKYLPKRGSYQVGTTFK
jgi:hypothetical protein